MPIALAEDKKLDRYNRVLSLFPDWMRESILIQHWSELINQEITSKLGDLYDITEQQTKITNVDIPLLDYWERMLDYNPSDNRTLELRKALLIEKISRKIRYRPNDIVAITRLLLTGRSTQVRYDIYNSAYVPVFDASIYSDYNTRLADPIYIGDSTNANYIDRIQLENIQSHRGLLFLRYPVTARAFDVVSGFSEVNIVEQPANYLFTINVEYGDISENVELLAGIIHEIKPAHLGFEIVAALYTYEDPRITTYNDPNSTYGIDRLYTTE